MQKVFFRNLIFLVTLNILIKPIWILGIDRTVQNVVGLASYGIYFVLFNLSMLTQILLDVGISNYNNRYLAQNENELTSHLSNIFSIKLILSGIYILVTVWSILFGKRLDEGQRQARPTPLRLPVAEAIQGHGGGVALHEARGTFVLALVFLAAFVLYYFVNWKYLGSVWGLS